MRPWRASLQVGTALSLSASGRNAVVCTAASRRVLAYSITPPHNAKGLKAGSAGHLRASRTRDPRSTLYIIWGAHHGPPPPPAYVDDGSHSKPFVIITLLVLVVITIGCIGGICYMCCDGGAQGQGERRRSSAKPAALPSQKSARQIMRENREGRGAQVYGKLGNLAVQQTTPAKPALTMKSPMKLKDYKASLQGGGQAATMH